MKILGLVNIEDKSHDNGIALIENQEIIEEAFFDTHPESDDASFEGVWNSYPFFESGVIALSDIKRGLFLIKRK